MPIKVDPSSVPAPRVDRGEAPASAKQVDQTPARAEPELARELRRDDFKEEHGPAASHDPDLGTKKAPEGRKSGLVQIDRALKQAIQDPRAPVQTAPPVPPRPAKADPAAPPLPPRPAKTPVGPASAGPSAAQARSKAQQLLGGVLRDVAGIYVKQGADQLLKKTLGQTPTVGEQGEVGTQLNPKLSSQQDLGALGRHQPRGSPRAVVAQPV